MDLKTDTSNQLYGNSIRHTLYTVDLNIKTYLPMSMLAIIRMGKLGFVQFYNPNTQISKIVYYTQSVDECMVQRNRIFCSPKFRK